MIRAQRILSLVQRVRPSRGLPTGAPIVVILFSLAALALHAYFYIPFITDDAFISLRYARRLLEGKGLTWNDGEYVEGYSNLLWVLVMAGLHWIFGVDWIVFFRILGFLSTAAACLALCSSIGVSRSIKPALFSVLPFVGSAPVAAWIMGGLEQSLVLAFLSWSIVFVLPFLDGEPISRKRVFIVAGLLGMLTLTRSDGALWGLATAGFVVLWRGTTRGSSGPAFIWIVAIFGAYFAQTLFRLWYYDAWVSNIAHIKLGITPTRFFLGLRYVGLGAAANFALIYFVLHGSAHLLLARLATGRLAFLSFLQVVWLTYVVSIGGDVNTPFRHLVPSILLVCFMLREIGSALASESSSAPLARLRGDARILAPVCFAAFLCFQILWAEHADARNGLSLGVRERMREGEVLLEAFPNSSPLVGLSSAGGLPFVSPWAMLDLMGLNDRHIALNPPPSAGHGWIGHDLGDPDYVMRRHPDILILEERDFSRPFHFINKALLSRADLHERYALANVKIDEPWEHIASIWFSRESAQLGYRFEEQSWVMPAYLCVAPEGVVAELRRGYGFATLLDPGESCKYRLTAAVPAANEISIEPASDALRIRRVEETGVRYVEVANASSDTVAFLRVKLR